MNAKDVYNELSVDFKSEKVQGSYLNREQFNLILAEREAMIDKAVKVITAWERYFSMDSQAPYPAEE